jgi:hypothetical protein
MSRSRDTADQINRVDSSAANSTAITIDSSENVGIGTSSPTAYTGYSTIALNGTNGGILEFKKGDTQMARITNAGDPVLQFATNNAEAMRIDGGNLLVGKTSADGGIAGFEARSTGETFATSSGASLYAKRTTGDGDIIVVQGSSGTVGSIQTGAGGYMHIKGGNNTFGSGIAFNNQTWNPTNASGTITDDHVKLGDTGSRFTDLYLSGGVYLGGTGAANKLEDAEQGAYTVAITTGSMTTNTAGAYTKLGSLVHFTFVVSAFTDSSSGNAVEFSLPFSAVNSAAVSCGFVNSGISLVLQGGYISSASGKIRFYAPEGTANAYRVMIHSDFLHTNCVMHVSGTYRSTV